MINLLVKIFVKNPEDIKNSAVRQSYGVLSGGVGICCNILLFCFKFLAGILTGAVSVAADAFNNLSDAGSSVITLVGFKMAGKPADNDHPFGHGRIEYISGLAVAVAIIVMGVELLRQSFDRILHPEAMEFSLLSVIILVGSILVKMWMAYFNYGLGKKIESAAMKGTATDSLSDCITTSVVLISVFVEFFTGFNIDGYAGAVVALFVLKHWKELSIGFVVIIVAGCIYLLAMLIRKYIRIQQKTAEMKKIAVEVGGTDIVIDHEKGKVSFSVPAENADAVINDIEKNMGNSKYKLKVSRVQNLNNEMKDKKTTDVGYVNKNSQRNNGKTEYKGTDNNQWFYSMECLKCGHKYFANGSDIKIRKCPNCQGGKP